LLDLAATSSLPAARRGAGEAGTIITLMVLTCRAKLQAESVRPSPLESTSVLMLTAKFAAVPLVWAGRVMTHSTAAK